MTLVQSGCEGEILIPPDNSVFLGVTSSETLKPQEVLPAKRLRSAAPRCEHTSLNGTSASNLIVGTKTFSFFLSSSAFFSSTWLMRLTFSTLCIPENEAAVFPDIHYRILKIRPRVVVCVPPQLSHRCEGCQSWWMNTRWFEDLTLFLSWRQSGVMESCRRRVVLSHEINQWLASPAAVPPCGSCRNTWTIHPTALHYRMSCTWTVKSEKIYMYICGQVQAVNTAPHQLAIRWC